MECSTAVVPLETSLSFVLALDRFRINLGLTYPTVVHTFCLVIAFFCAVAYVLFTPWYGLLVITGVYATCFNDAKPYSHLLQQIITLNIMIVSGGTLIIYLVIIGHLVRMHLKFKSSNQLSISKQEKSILSYALVRFITDVTLVVSYSLVTSSPTPLIMFLQSFGYNVNILSHNFAPDLQYVRIYVKTTFRGQMLKWQFMQQHRQTEFSPTRQPILRNQRQTKFQV
ncbi:hypothetical protein L596_026644 [Steinernema carpocapsae]|uniref:G-protein coupled receptors family 1 profile domain-containing protein n=1 Tax=Steinernema carpocapsae TaxID=34508 RepID=A0A4U5M2Y3_STECR|nr:hypothetical protein L596_026644 [Steinernema carpocapsae]